MARSTLLAFACLCLLFWFDGVFDTVCLTFPRVLHPAVGAVHSPAPRVAGLLLCSCIIFQSQHSSVCVHAQRRDARRDDDTTGQWELAKKNEFDDKAGPPTVPSIVGIALASNYAMLRTLVQTQPEKCKQVCCLCV